MWCSSPCCTTEEGVVEVAATPLFEQPSHKPSAAVVHGTAEASREVAAPAASAAAPAKEAEVGAGAHLDGDILAGINKSALEAPLGLQLDFCDGMVLWVSDVKPGASPVSEYNATVPAEKQVRVGDYIVAVDGKGGTKQMKQLVEALQQSTSPVLRVRRPHVFTCMVAKGGRSLGLNLIYTQASRALVVAAIGEGAIKADKLDLAEGDRITAVNGKEGTALQLMAELKEAPDSLVLHISRCPKRPS